MNKIPAFRIEIRDDDSKWWPIEFSHTLNQAEFKVARAASEFGPDNVRHVPNEPLVEPAPSSNPTPQTPAPAPAPQPPAVVLEPTPAAAPPIDALVGVTPLPFGVGAVLEDIHTHGRVRVTKIHDADQSGRGFDWENLDTTSAEKTGTCPINAIGNFVAVETFPAGVHVTSGMEIPSNVKIEGAQSSDAETDTARSETPGAAPELATEPAPTSEPTESDTKKKRVRKPRAPKGPKTAHAEKPAKPATKTSRKKRSP